MKKVLLGLTVSFTLTVAHGQYIEGGAYYSLFLCTNRTAMGCGSDGALGNGNNNYDTLPVSVNSLSCLTALCAGNNHSLFLKNDGTVWACGDNSYGQLGIGSSAIFATKINSLNNVVAIAAGGRHSLFLKKDGTVWACGYNLYGQLGDSTNINRSIPVQVKNLTNIIAISGGYLHSLFLKNDGTVWGTGYNNFGNLGDGTNTTRYAPVQADSLYGITTAISAGASNYSLFLKNDSTVWACGSNSGGMFGNGTNSGSAIPIRANALTGVTAISAGTYATLFLKNDGTVWASGDNLWGQLGDGTTKNSDTIVQVNITNVIGIAKGEQHSLFLRQDSTVWACGANWYGALGNGTVASDSFPKPVQNLCSVYINPFPTVSVSLNPDTVCINISPYTLTGGSPSGGTYSGNGVSGGNFNPSVAGIGLHNIIYTYTDGSNCSNNDTAQIYVDLCTSIKTYSNTKIISIIPNPFCAQTVLQTDNPLHNATLTVDNCFGQTVAQIKNLRGQTIVFNRDNLSSGLYFVRLTEENKTITVDKFVITDK